MSEMKTFTYRSARSGALLAGFGLAIAVETLVLHLWLVARHPIVAWTLTAGSVATLAWLVADYRSFGRGVVRLSEDLLELRVGLRFAASVPTSAVMMATRPTWRDLPTRGTPAAAGYLNLMKPGTPNVLLTLAVPTTVRLPGGLRRSALRLGLRLDAPDDFLAALHDSAGAPGSSASVPVT
jgi:hypothetical protein